MVGATGNSIPPPLWMFWILALILFLLCTRYDEAFKRYWNHNPFKRKKKHKGDDK